jgi:hypothetical protein
LTTKKGKTKTKNFPSFVAIVGSGIRDPRSRMDKNQDPGSEIKTSQIRNTATSQTNISVSLVTFFRVKNTTFSKLYGYKKK